MTGPTEAPRTLSELNRLAEQIGARVVTNEALEFLTAAALRPLNSEAVEGLPAEPAGLPPEALDWARQLVEQGYRDEHIVTFTETGYGLEHPIRCRPNLIGCQFNEWLASQMAPDQEPGRYVMTWAKSGPKYAAYAEGEE